MSANVDPSSVTGQMHFDSHVWVVTDVACRLVNALTTGYDGTRPVDLPAAGERAEVCRQILTRPDYRPTVTAAEGDALAALAERVRGVFTAAADGDLSTAARAVNDLLEEYGAVTRLEEARGGGWTLHFHGRDSGLVVGWGAGIAAGLAMAIGSDLAGRLGVCEAAPCDRVFVDTSKNAGRRFCSTRCQSRVKAAAHRARARA